MFNWPLFSNRGKFSLLAFKIQTIFWQEFRIRLNGLLIVYLLLRNFQRRLSDLMTWHWIKQGLFENLLQILISRTNILILKLFMRKLSSIWVGLLRQSYLVHAHMCVHSPWNWFFLRDTFWNYRNFILTDPNLIFT